MFEIGNSLREARLRQGLDLATVEAHTKIRTKYLNALEEERFDVLPAETYVKGFLRTYADHLGLDGQLYVDEFNTRFASEEEDVLVAPSRPPRRLRTGESNAVVVALVAIVAVTLLVVVAWRIGAPEPAADVALTPPAPLANEAAPASPTPAPPAPAAAKPKPNVARLALEAARGDCWLEIRAGSPTGELLYQGTLEQGQTLRLARKRLWMLVGAGSNLDAMVNGKPVAVPVNSAIVVGPRGVRSQS